MPYGMKNKKNKYNAVYVDCDRKARRFCALQQEKKNASIAIETSACSAAAEKLVF